MRSSRSRAPDPLNPGAAGFAHRGRHGPRPFVENSLTAFAAALEMGAGIECDVRLTADGELVVFHDLEATRLTGVALCIDRATLAEVQSLPFANQPIPTLRQLLAVVDGRTPVLIEAKCAGRRHDWCRALGAALSGYRGRVGVMSFDAGLMLWVRHKLPGVRRGLVVADGLGRFKRWIALRMARPDFLAVETTAAARPWAQGERSRIPLYSWTVRSAEQRRHLDPLTDALIWEGDGRP